MKNRILIIAAIAILCAATPLYAQTNTIKADVPFDFSVKNKSYSAGKYVIDQPIDDHGQRMVWMLRNQDKGIVLLAKTKENADRGAGSSLVFNRYGDTYFFAKFVTSGLTITLPTSRAERDLQKGGGQNLAKAEFPETVVVAAAVD